MNATIASLCQITDALSARVAYAACNLFANDQQAAKVHARAESYAFALGVAAADSSEPMPLVFADVSALKSSWQLGLASKQRDNARHAELRQSSAYLAALPARIDSVEASLGRDCGGSDVLFASGLQAALEDLLSQAPVGEYAVALDILIARGLDRDAGQYQGGADECAFTGIEYSCCPCGRCDED